MKSDLKQLVLLETPSTNKKLLDRAATFISTYAKKYLNAQVEVIQQARAGNHVIIKIGHFHKKPVLILTHYDTVWPEGTLDKMPFSIKNGKILGPGVFDMKGGIVQGLWAIRALLQYSQINTPIVLLCTSDEEIGSNTSRPLIEKWAINARAVLVLEPSFMGKLKTARKGVGEFLVQIKGKASHAGIDPENGVSAIVELAHQILNIQSLANTDKGTTVNIGVVRGGIRSNIVPPTAEAEIDVRITTMNEARRIKQQLLQLKPYNPRTTITVTGDINRPPMVRTEQVAQLFYLAKTLGHELGLELDECAVGGASDGNFCAALDVPVLDGLGAVGGGAHSYEEYLLADQMPYRAALVALLLQRL